MAAAGLTPDEQQIIKAKYASLRFGAIAEADRPRVMALLLLKLHVITGWPVPVKELKDILIDELEKTLLERFPNVNAEEVEHAFRSTSVRNWGMSMSVVLVCEVLEEYLERRREVSRKEEQRRMNALPMPAPERWAIDRAYAFYLASLVDKRIKPPLKKWITYENE